MHQAHGLDRHLQIVCRLHLQFWRERLPAILTQAIVTRDTQPTPDFPGFVVVVLDYESLVITDIAPTKYLAGPILTIWAVPMRGLAITDFAFHVGSWPPLVDEFFPGSGAVSDAAKWCCWRGCSPIALSSPGVGNSFAGVGNSFGATSTGAASARASATCPLS